MSISYENEIPRSIDIKVKRINWNVKIIVLAEDEIDKTRVLEYSADEFTTKPISQSIVESLHYVSKKSTKLD